MTLEKYSDTHTLYVKCETATETQIRKCFHTALKNYQDQNNHNLDTRFNVNLVTNKYDESFGIAFVYLIEPAFYYMLLGKNPDGSDRIEYIDDPSRVMPSDDELKNESGWSSVKPPVYNDNMSWADICEIEEEYEKSLSHNNVSKIATSLEPLIKLPPYTLTEEQIQKKKQKIILSNINVSDFNKDKIVVPITAHLQIEKALVDPINKRFMHNILKSKDVPSWVSKEDLKIKFSPYASDNKTRYERVLKGVSFNETYPFVNINKDGVCFIIFDPSTHDAQFALLMSKKTIIKKDIGGKKLSAMLRFRHSYCTDRDLMTSIINTPKVINNPTKKHPKCKTKPKTNPTQPTTLGQGFRIKNSYAALNCE